MIHPRAIVITVTKTIVRGQPLLRELTTSLLEAAKNWSGEKTPAYFLIRVEGIPAAVAWELGDIPSDLEAVEAWVASSEAVGRAETVSHFDPMQPSQKAQRTRIEKRKVVSAGPLDRSMKPADVLPALRPLLSPEGRRECDRIWCFLADFVEKTPGDIQAMERLIAAMPDDMPALHAADHFMKGTLSASMRSIAEHRPGVTMVVCSWPLDLRDGRPDFATLNRKARQLIEFRRPTQAVAISHRDDDLDLEIAAAKYC